MGIAIYVASGKASSLEVAKSEFLACSGTQGTIYDDGCDEVTTESLCFDRCTVTEQSSCIQDKNSCGTSSHSLSEYFFCKSNTYAIVKTVNVQMPKDFDSNASSNVVTNYHYCFWYTFSNSVLACMVNGARFQRNSLVNNSIGNLLFFGFRDNEVSDSNFIGNGKKDYMLWIGTLSNSLEVKNCVFIKNEYNTFIFAISKAIIEGCLFFECIFGNNPELTTAETRPNTKEAVNPLACLLGTVYFSERKESKRNGLFASFVIVSDDLI